MTDFDMRPEDTCLLVIDMQERFQKAIPSIVEEGTCGRATRILIEGAGHLEVPVVFSEQYPKGLGPTLSYLREAAAEAPIDAKTHFSCCDDKGLRERLATFDRPWVIVCGIEAHVCVLATVDDLLRRGYRVAVVAEATDSRNPANRDLAHAAMRQLGALVLPLESVLFRLQRQAGVGAFKAISGLVK